MAIISQINSGLSHDCLFKVLSKKCMYARKPELLSMRSRDSRHMFVFILLALSIVSRLAWKLLIQLR